MTDKKLIVASPPHIRSVDDTRTIMLDVIIALIPAILAGIYFFGYRAGVVVLITVAGSVLFEHLWCVMLGKESSVYDLSAVVSGVLLALCLPVTVPLWVPVVGAFFMIIFVKMCFGGLGQNFMNPALAARAFLLASWPMIMTTWVEPLKTKLYMFNNPDVVTSATPLALIKGGVITAKLPSYIDMYFGSVGGCIGEVSAFALMLGGMYLLYRKVISWHIPITYMATVAALVWLLGGDPLYHLLAGGLMLGSIFMATDYVTSPITASGKLIFGVGLGGLTVLIRIAGGYPEGVCYSILLMNILVPFIDKSTKPRRFGGSVRPNA